MTKILFVLNGIAGGATLSAIGAMKELRRRGYECYAVVEPNRDLEGMRLLRDACCEVAEVALPWWRRKYLTTWYKRPVHLLREAWSSGFYVGTIRKLVTLCKTWQINIVHTNTALNIQGASAARRCGIPHVWHIRELVGNQALFRFWLPDRLLAATLIRRSDAVIANSEETRKFFTRFGFHDRVDVIYNGLDLEPFLQDDSVAALRAKWNISDEPLIGMIANLTSRSKRHDTFIRMAAIVREQCPNAKFVIVGHDPTKNAGPQSEQSYTQQLKTLSKMVGLGDHLIWAGKCADIPAVMRSLDIVVHPSGQESFGRVGVEAMAAAKPMVAAREGGLGEVIADSVTGFSVPENDINGFANAVITLIRDPSLRNTLGIAGRERAKRLFTVERMVDQFESVYRRVLKSDTITATNRAEMLPTVAAK